MARDVQRDILDSVVCDMLTVESDTILPKVEDSEVSSETIGEEVEECADEENARRKEERLLIAKKHSSLRGQARVSDCLLRQLANLLFKLTEDSHPAKVEVVHEDRNIISDIDIFRRYCSIAPDVASVFTSHNDTVSQCPKYPKPRYLLEYPGIFGKSPRASLDAQTSIQELDRLFSLHHAVDENVRNNGRRRQGSTDLDEKAT